MAYDPARERVILYGGRPGYMDDTWEWDGATWTQIGAGAPTKRTSHAMAYDESRRQLVLFGGFRAYDQADTWEFGCTAHTRADWNRDGVVDELDVVAFLDDWAQGRADYDNNTLTNTRDVIAFLADWALAR